MKLLQLLFFTFLFFELSAQDSTHVSAFLKDGYKVYPFEQNIDINPQIYSLFPYIQTIDNRVITNEKFDTTDLLYYRNNRSFYYSVINDENIQVDFYTNIAPSLDTLSDGKYIQYYSPQPYSDGDTIKFIRNRISAVFYLKNNLLNGPFYGFDYAEQNKEKTGFYLSGTREGKWRLNQFSTDYYGRNSRIFKKKKNHEMFYTLELVCEYSNGLIEGPLIITNSTTEKETFVEREITNFLHGKEEGAYNYYINNILIAQGYYTQGVKSGDWYIYTWKDRSNKEILFTLENTVLLEHLKYNDRKEKGKSVIIRCDNHSWGGIVDGFYTSGYSYTNMPEPLEMKDHYDDFFDMEVFKDEYGDFTRQEIIDSLGYTFKYTEYERYYPNGQLFTKFKLVNGSLEAEGDIFWETGKLKNSIRYVPEKNQYIENRYLETGILKESILYDHIAKKVEMLFPRDRITINDRVYLKNFGNNFYFNSESTDIPLRDMDSVFLISDHITLNNDVSNKKITYYPKNRTVTKFEKIHDTPATLTSIIQYDTSFGKCTTNETLKFEDLVIHFKNTDSVFIDYRKRAREINELSHYSNDLSYMGQFERKNTLPEIFYKNKPFSGKVTIYITDKKEKVIKRGNHLIIYLRKQFDVWLVCMHGFPIILDYLNTYTYSLHPLKDKRLEKSENFYHVHSIEFQYAGGKIIDDCKIYNKKNQTLAYIPISNNKIEGSVTCYVNYIGYVNDHHPVDPESQHYFLSRIENYEQGKKNGPVYEFNSKGDTILSSNYVDDQLNGTYISKRNNEIEYRYYQNGKSTGIIQTIDSKGIVLEELRYVNHQLDGKASFYTDKGKLYQTANFKEGQLHDSVILYNPDKTFRKILIYRKNAFLKELIYDNGILHEEFFNDTTSTYFAIPISKRDEFSSTLCDLYYPSKYNAFKDYYAKSGKMIYYNHQGEIVKQGMLKNNLKTGLWHYHYPQPLGDYTIYHTDSSIRINDTLMFPTKGEFIQKDQQGNILSKRYIISETPLYNCGQNEIYDILLYYVAYEKDSSLRLKNGYIKNYYPTLVKQSEGQNINGLPTGLWKFYNDNGSLREIGYFTNGKKTGRWLSGDLSKIHYMGDICLNLDNIELSRFVEESEKQLEITETFFENGTVLIQNHFRVTK